MVFLTMLCTSLAYSQDVSGTVSDSSGPLPGASVLVKGTTNGAQTDLDGKFTIKKVGPNAVLVFSFIGLKSQEVKVAGKSSVKVTLSADSAELKEVVVIGYGSTTKKDATGAVDQLSSKKFDNVAATNPASLLQGKVSGVQVTTTSGEPGAAMSVRIRGNGSLRSGNGPLVVVDGVPLGGGNVSSGSDVGLGATSAKDPLSYINQNDIESMSILKDASSTAIYGSRGANGVIIITTKKGKSKEPELTYSTSYQIGNYASKFNVLNAAQFTSLTPTADHLGGNFDWKKEVLQTSTSMNHDLAYSSSTDKSNTRVSLGMTNTDGLIKTTGLNKYTASLYNSNDLLNGALKIETRLAYTELSDTRTLNSNNTGYIGNVIGAALYWNPTASVQNADGTYAFQGNTILNPVQLMHAYTNKGDLTKFIGNLTATLKLTSALKYKFLLGIEQSKSYATTQLLPSIPISGVGIGSNPSDGQQYFGLAQINSDLRDNKTIEHNLTYDKDFSSKFHLNALVGYSYYNYLSRGSFMSATGFPASQTNLVDDISGGIPSMNVETSYKTILETQSVFARASLAFANKLNLDLTVRRDGSSNNAAGKKYANFPSAGLGYKLVDSKEGLVNDLKLRLNVGKTGNSNFPINSSVGVLSYAGPNGFNIINNANSQITWEVSTSYGIGTDFTLVHNRLSGSIDYFYKDTNNLIVPLASSSGQPSPVGIKYTNIAGDLINKGLEVGLNFKAIDTQDLRWDISGNMAFLANKMTKMTSNALPAGTVDGQGLSNAYVETIQNNTPLYTYNIPVFKGYDSNGQSQYINPDGSVVGSANAQNTLSNKQALPTMTAGISTSVSYKNWDFSTSMYGAFGNYIYNNTANALFYQGAFGGKNSTMAVATSAQNASDANTPSTKYLEKGDFMRMGNLTIGYTFKNLEKYKIRSARFYVNGSNLFVLTKYTGFDPEVDTDKTLNGIPSAGIDYLSYPKARSFALGLNVTF